MDVTSEPFHKPVFQTDELTLIKLEMENGDTSLFHQPSSPILYIAIEGAKMWLDEAGVSRRTVNLPDGWIGSDSYSRVNPFVHRISVFDEGPLKLIAIIRNKAELKEYKYKDGFTLLENGFAVRIDSMPASMEYINVILSGSAILDKISLGPGDYFLPCQIPENRSNDFESCAVYF